MLRHVVLFTWNADASDVQVRAFAEGLAGLPGRIPEIRSYRFGPDVGLGGGNEDFALVADFDDVQAYRRYAEHPAHRHVIAELLWPILGGRHAVQYEV
ncbi:MAG TPA: Dabb family protein [Acidimicrobiales bacterium]|nr:Dabb family protein [Acidimicrobiales bacterium]